MTAPFDAALVDPLTTIVSRAAAAILADLRLRANGRTEPLEALPESCRPATLDDAYAVQDVLRALLAKRGLGAPCGWKIGCTTAVMQAYLDIPHPCAGTLYRNSVSSGETRWPASFSMWSRRPTKYSSPAASRRTRSPE